MSCYGSCPGCGANCRDLDQARADLAQAIEEREAMRAAKETQTTLARLQIEQAMRLRAVLADTDENVLWLAQWQLRADYPNWEKEGGGWDNAGHAERATRLDDARAVLAALRARAGMETTP